MLSEPGASRSGNSGLASSAKRRYLKLVISSVDLQNERRQGYERGLAQCTKELIAVVLRKSSATLTSTRAGAAYLRSANRTDSPWQTTVSDFRC